MHDRHFQHELQLQEAVATFINTLSNHRSLITITRTSLSTTGDTATFFVSVFPEDAEGPALGFLKRKRSECRTHIKKTLPTIRIPHIDFAIDEGEKHRRTIDELLG